VGIASGFDVTAFLAGQLADCETGWSLGAFGAIAEFTRDAGEAADQDNDGSAISVVTARGGIRLQPIAELKLFASESTTRESWSHRVSLCLPADRSGMGRRAVLTELGPDTQTLRDEDRGAILFDLGLDCPQVDACIRVADPDVAARLRAHAGRPVFEPGNPAMSIVVPASPHRVFISRVGRIEVFQPIPPPNGKSPEGPHTHVLPKLLRHARTHSATEPVPEGFVPCAHFYPAHPIKDALGQALPFDARRHDAFQRMLRLFGDPGALMLKQRVMAAVGQGRLPSDIVVPNDRFARANVRVAIRQMRLVGDPPSARAAWAQALDQGHADAADEDDGDPHHASCG
jgi:hypothetical protein